MADGCIFGEVDVREILRAKTEQPLIRLGFKQQPVVKLDATPVPKPKTVWEVEPKTTPKPKPKKLDMWCSREELIGSQLHRAKVLSEECGRKIDSGLSADDEALAEAFLCEQAMLDVYSNAPPPPDPQPSGSGRKRRATPTQSQVVTRSQTVAKALR